MTATQDIVARLWNLCHVLRDDGVSYHQYVTELTFLLFLKMAQEIGIDAKQLPDGHRWRDLEDRDGTEQLDFYKKLLIHLGTHGSARVTEIFANAQTCITKPKNLKTLIAAIDALNWYEAKEEGLGDMYEGLLQKNASERKSGAGQYFTPGPLIDRIVHLMQPKAGEIIGGADERPAHRPAVARFACTTARPGFDSGFATAVAASRASARRCQASRGRGWPAN